MSIQSTRVIDRQETIDRINDIQALALNCDYRELESLTYDTNYNIQIFVDKYIPIDLTHVDKWTNSMLGDIINKPFFRYSIFDNYEVEG